MDWCLDDLHHGCSIPWGKHLLIIGLVFVESNIAHRFAQDKKNPNCRLPGKKHIDVVRWSYDIWSYHPIFNLCSFCQSAGSSPCHSSACPIITERRRKEEKWSLHWRWIFIMLRIDLSSGWSMFKIIFLSRLKKQLFPAHDLILSALCKGTNNTKTTNKNRKQPVLKVVDWQNLTKLSQVKDNVLSALYPYSHPIQCIFHYAISLVFLAKIIYIYLQISFSTRFLGTKSSPWLASSSSWLTGLWALPCLLQATPWLPKSPTVSPIAENHFMYLLCLAIIRVWNPAVNYDIRSAKGEPITTFIHCITA